MDDEAPEQERVKRYIRQAKDDMMDRLAAEREKRLAVPDMGPRKFSTMTEMQLSAVGFLVKSETYSK